MAQVTALRTGKWSNQLATAEEVAEKVAEVREIVNRYGWMDRSVHPYGFAIKMEDFLAGFDDYRRCTHYSKQISLKEMNGFIEILNAWIKEAEAPKVTVRLLKGKHQGEIKEIPESYLEDYIDLGMAERV